MPVLGHVKPLGATAEVPSSTSASAIEPASDSVLLLVPSYIATHHQTLVVTGSVEELGCWDVSKGVKLQRAADGSEAWYGLVQLPLGKPIEAKVVVVEHGVAVRWEAGHNRNMLVLPSASHSCHAAHMRHMAEAALDALVSSSSSSGEGSMSEEDEGQVSKASHEANTGSGSRVRASSRSTARTTANNVLPLQGSRGGLLSRGAQPVGAAAAASSSKAGSSSSDGSQSQPVPIPPAPLSMPDLASSSSSSATTATDHLLAQCLKTLAEEELLSQQPPKPLKLMTATPCQASAASLSSFLSSSCSTTGTISDVDSEAEGCPPPAWAANLVTQPLWPPKYGVVLLWGLTACTKAVDDPLSLAAHDPTALGSEGGCSGCQPGLAARCTDVWL